MFHESRCGGWTRHAPSLARKGFELLIGSKSSIINWMSGYRPYQTLSSETRGKSRAGHPKVFLGMTLCFETVRPFTEFWFD